jgi:membrane protein
MSPVQVRRVIVGTIKDVDLNHILAFAAALSYYFVMAFFPALIALAAIVAYLPVPNLFDSVIGTLARVVPPESMGLIRKIVADVISPSRGALLSFGLIGTLWTCSSGFAAMIEALNVAYDVPETRPLWKTRLLAIQLLFLVGTLVTFAFTFMILGPRFGEFLASQLGMGQIYAVIWPVLRYLLAITFIVLAVTGLYYMGPNLKQPFSALVPGALLAVVGWILLSDGLSIYFHRFAHLNRTYGVLGGGIAFLTWLYWSGFLILLGAELNSEIIQQRGDGTLPLKQPPPRKVRPTAATTGDVAKSADDEDDSRRRTA